MNHSHAIQNKTDRKLIPLTKWNHFHSWPPLGGLRHLAFYARDNGFSHCLIKVGRRVLIDESKFFEWVDNQKKQKEGGK